MAKAKKTIKEPKEEKAPSPDISALQEEIEILKKRDAENQEKLKMLYEVADKGRVFNYESRRAEKKPLKVKLSVYKGKTIIGWQTLKDELIKHPSTGLTVGEKQEYEIALLDKEGNEEKILINGYPAFSDARYGERIECDVVGKREDYEGNIDFDLQLPDGRKITINSRFVN
jgi:hypothetical protein